MTNPEHKETCPPEWSSFCTRLSAALESPLTLNDLSAVGALHACLEEGAIALAAVPPLAEYLRGLTAALASIILQEHPEPVAALHGIHDALQGIAEAPDAATAAGSLPDIPNGFGSVPGEGTADPAGGRHAPDAPRPFGEIVVHKPEDTVVYREFIEESHEHLDRIELRVMTLETEPNNLDLINDMFRCFHSMKGAAGFLGLIAINELCHEVETLLDRCRKMTLRIHPPVVEVILASIDTAKRQVEYLANRVAPPKGSPPPDEADAPDIRPVLEAVRLVLHAPPPPSRFEEDADIDMTRVGGVLVREGVATAEDVGKALARQKTPLGKILVESGSATEEAVEGALARSGLGGQHRSESIKVDTKRLDALLEMVGELVIAQSQVAQDATRIALEHTGILRNIGNLGKITGAMQELVMDMRLVPLRGTFQKMLRVVRDTAKRTGKEAVLLLSGEDTEIDKAEVEEIADPLVHLLRNAVDHGIEPPDVREAKGKPRQGTVRLSASHQGGHVVIAIRDDGAGIPREAVLRKAVERGWVAEGEEPSDAEVFDFIFHPGFSTHAVATDISGRGVGMDVVRRNIEGLGGHVEVESEAGRGSVFTVRLPLTMAIVDGMVVTVGGSRYILPTIGIEESVRPAAEQVFSVTGRGRVMNLRGDLVPIVDLAVLFGGQPGRAPEEALVMVVRDGERRCGLVVEDLLGQQQVVVKSLGQHMQGVVGVSGGCILGDGRVGLILDVSGLVRLAQGEGHAHMHVQGRGRGKHAHAAAVGG